MGRRVATAGLLVALGISLLLSVPALRPVLRAISQISPLWIAVAVALELASCVSFVIIFRLFFDRVGARDARALAWTEMASGALLPGGGVGGLAIGGWLMHLTGAPTRWIVRRSGGLFFLTSAVNSAAVIGAGLLLLAGAAGPHDFARAALPALLAGAATLIVLALPWIASRRRTVPVWLDGVIVGIRDAQRTARHPRWRLVAALGYPGFDIAVLWVAFSAVGTSPPLPALVLGYSIGYLANTLPIPGGIGVLDAGLSAALLLYGSTRPRGRGRARLPRNRVLDPLPRRPDRLRPPAPTPDRSQDRQPARILPHPDLKPIPITRPIMTALALIIRPTRHGWAVYLTDGREVARFNGPAAKRRALRSVASATKALQTPAVAKKGASPPTGATC